MKIIFIINTFIFCYANLFYAQPDQIIGANKIEVNMTTGKKVYKKFEPVIAKLEFINKDDKTFEIWSTAINSWSELIHINIEDDLGNKWNTCKTPYTIDYIDRIVFYLQPGDTFITTIPINNWAEKLDKYPGYLFNVSGYFPEGRKYKAYYTYNNYRNLISNEVEFEVIDINEEDEKLIKLYYDISGKITLETAESIAVSIYPGNIFTEYLSAEGTAYRHRKMLNEKYDFKSPGLIKDYRAYFEKYPDTYFVYDFYFMSPYYAKIYSSTGDFKKAIKYSKKKINNAQLNRQLSYRNMGSRIESMLELINK